MQQHELRQPAGATHKRKRIGRGNASGHGTYSTKGMKGQKARAGGGVRPGFEGGQLPLVRRMAYKRGFRNPFRVDYEEVNVGALSVFSAGTEVNDEALRNARLVRTGRPVKVLGQGELSVALTVEAASFSKSARDKIQAAGGSVRWLNGEPPAEEEAPAEAPKPKRAAKAEKPAAKAAEEEAPKPKREAKTEKPAAKAAEEEASDGAGS
ncbi:MAG: 50S ribosomal protein L15 [Dehalococcoidia bacterium]|nr:MAG: 50S ribosomal protein L15 [Dehalococcoidia bacterium]